jgi:hypothetical protein
MGEQANPALEFGSKPEDLVAFNEAIGAIKTHNDQFSLGKLMAGALIDHIDESGRAQELVEAGVPLEEAEATIAWVGTNKVPMSEEEQMARSIVGVTNAPVLEATGLTLSPLRKTATMFSSKGQQSVGRVRLNVTDGGKFSGFLLATKPEDIDESFRKNSESVVSSLVEETSDAIATDADDQAVLETLAYGNGIIAGLEHIGLGESPAAQKLSALTEHTQQGDVKEWVLASRIGLLEEPEKQQFGPSQWQGDATPKYLSDRWGEVIAIIKMAKDNPRSSSLFTQLLSKARSDLGYAKQDWEKLKVERYSGDINPGYGEGFSDVFASVDVELQALDPGPNTK